MELQDLLRHIADNVENEKHWVTGLTYDNPNARPVWDDVAENHDRFKLAPRTHDVNGFTVPAPEVEGLDKGQEYFFPCANHKEWVGWYFWSNDKCDTLLLERRSVFLTQEAAIANAKAMLGIDPYSEGEE